ncbi:cyclin-A2-like [Schistocerca gregaria]|uniref:cyclin-A2-like n=1 Tax=Schistocerca gregaria TaxID=7010 RepID=UPI00211DB0E4|nr:cyclin-A2-like [Schistocerca gregaria]
MAASGINHNVDQENRTVNAVHMRKEELENQPKKRTVLGVLNKNAERIRCQKPAKQDAKLQEKNLKTGKQITQPQRVPFEIPEDKLDEDIEVRKVHAVKQNKVSPSTKDLQRVPLKELPVPIFEDVCTTAPQDKNSLVSEQFIEETALVINGYTEDVYRYLREIEERHRPRAGYMKKQPDITYSMRCILVDWLVEVAEEYKLQTETLYLAVSFIDRFLSYMSVVRAKLQLVGTAAMFIAAKYEEIYPPDVKEFVYITDDTYTKKQVLRMEHLILKVLSFDLSVPTVLTFLTTFFSVDKVSDTVLYLAMYLSELTLVEGDPYLQYLPSVRAGAAIALARHTLEQAVWPQELETFSGYSLADLKPCIECLQKTFGESATHPQQAIREKYKSHRWHCVSLLAPRDAPIC